MNRTELLATVRDILRRAGFSVSNPYVIHLPGFDLVARRDDTLLIIKVLVNIDSITEKVAQELQTLAHLLKATPLLVGEKNGINLLEDDVAYFRFGIQTVTPATLKSHALEQLPVRAYAAPGGLYVYLDQVKIRQLRQEKNISLGTFARHVRVSRRTVRMYEEGMSARIDIADRIEELFEQPVTTPIDLFKPVLGDAAQVSPFHHQQEHLKQFQREVLSFLRNVGYNVIQMDRCPFEALSKEKEKILLTCVQEYNKKLKEKAHFMHDLSRIIERHAVVFTDKDVAKKNMEGIPIIVKKELRKLHDPEDVFALILERIIAE
ncbi:MAG: transcriptional regulator [Candidatus Thermoplasmatota archaeon]|nr:transcriptional regulator [Candidatus Thermoplasmatota archaeon]